MRLITPKQDKYCENCSYQAIVVETETETHIYCENCQNYVIIDKNDVESDKCCLK